MSLLHRLRLALIALATVFAVGVVGYRWLTNKSWLESIYYFVITVSGVGYTESSSSPPEVQLFSIFLILIGMLVVGYTLTMLLQSMIEGQIYRALGVRRMTQEIEKMSGHTIICGLGRMGKTLMEEFTHSGIPFVVIEQDSDRAIAARAENLLVITGDALDEETLLAAGVMRAGTFLASLNSDAKNVFLTLTVRDLNSELRIIARGELPSTEKKLRQAGANQVVLPAVISARRVASMVTHPHAAELVDLITDHHTLDAELEEITIGPMSKLLGKTISEAAPSQKHQLLIIAIRRSDGQMLFNPDSSLPFTQGDTLIAMGKKTDLIAFQKANHLIKE